MRTSTRVEYEIRLDAAERWDMGVGVSGTEINVEQILIRVDTRTGRTSVFVTGRRRLLKGSLSTQDPMTHRIQERHYTAAIQTAVTALKVRLEELVI